MTDNEIIKALECCTADNNMCNHCPYDNKCIDGKKNLLEEDVLNLINRQKAEIEHFREITKKIESEARQEFAERLKAMHRHNTTSVVSLVTVFDNINNLLAEMESESNA